MWKIQLIIAINFISSIDKDEEWVMHSKSDNLEVMISYKPEEVIKVLFQSLFSRCQIVIKQMLNEAGHI